jgi:small-conductance mechanosensitive channel
VVLWISGLLPVLEGVLESVHWRFGGARVSLMTVLEAAVSVVMVLLVTLWLSGVAERRLQALVPAGSQPGDLSLRKMAVNASRTLLLVVGVLMALSAAGIPLTALSVFGGALGVGIGLGLQRLAANYVSGFVILAERSLRIGDLVKVDTFEGRITDINTRYTVIRAPNGRESIVPNEVLLTQRIENATLADSRVLVSGTVVVDNGSNVEGLMPALVTAMKGVPRVLAEPEPAVQLARFAPEGIELQYVFWISDPDNGQGNVRSDVNLAVLSTLRRLGIDFPITKNGV